MTEPLPSPPRIVVMGVSGSGKSLIGAALGERMHVPFTDADDLHPASNVAKMSAGTPLDDDDRMPWLDVVGTTIRTGAGHVIACSALKEKYRDRLRAAEPNIWFVALEAPRTVLAERMQSRPGHFMPLALLDSQLATLEPLSSAEAGVTLRATDDADSIVEAALRSYSAWATRTTS